MPLRTPTREEKTALNRAFDTWSVFDYFKERTSLVMVNETKGERQIILVSEAMEGLIERKHPHFAGLVIGTLKKSFMPTMAGADLFVRLASTKNNTSFPHAVVNEEAEKLVLYGRDIMGNSIVSMSELLPENKIVAILNEKKQAIGIGKTRFSGKGNLTQDGRITITTMVDAGLYLREEGDGEK